MKEVVVTTLDKGWWFEAGTEIAPSGKKKGKATKRKKSIAQKREGSISDYACKCDESRFTTRLKAHEKIIKKYHWHVRIFLCLVGSCHRSHIRTVIKGDEHDVNVLIEHMIANKEIRRIVIPNASQKATEIFCWNDQADSDAVMTGKLFVYQIIKSWQGNNIDMKSSTMGMELMDKLMRERYDYTSKEYPNEEYDMVRNVIDYWVKYFDEELSQHMQSWHISNLQLFSP